MMNRILFKLVNSVSASEGSKFHFNMSLLSIQVYYYYEDSVENSKVSSFSASWSLVVIQQQSVWQVSEDFQGLGEQIILRLNPNVYPLDLKGNSSLIVLHESLSPGVWQYKYWHAVSLKVFSHVIRNNLVGKRSVKSLLTKSHRNYIYTLIGFGNYVLRIVIIM